VANAYQSVASAASFTCSKPTGTASGDTLTAAVFGIGSTTFASLSGWTQRATATNSIYTLTILTKIAGGSEPATYTFTGPPAAGATVIVRSSGGDTSAVIDGTPTSSATATVGSITTTSANSLLIMATVGLGDTTGTSIAPDAAMTERAELVEANVAYGSLEVATELRASAGATGTRTSTDASAIGFLTAMVAIKEASTAASHPLTGDLAGSSLAAATQIVLSHPLAGDLAGSSLASATGLGAIHALTGDLAGSALAQATGLILSHPLAGGLAGSALAAVSGVVLSHPLSGDLAGSSLAAATTLTASHALFGDLAGASLAEAVGLSVNHPLGGDLAGSSLAVSPGFFATELLPVMPGDARVLTWTDGAWPDLTNALVWVTVSPGFEALVFDAYVQDNTAVVLDLSASDAATLTPGRIAPYQVTADLDDRRALVLSQGLFVATIPGVVMDGDALRNPRAITQGTAATLTWDDPAWPALDDVLVTVFLSPGYDQRVYDAITLDDTMVSLDLNAANTAALDAGTYVYELRAAFDRTRMHALMTGVLTVSPP